jgi:hypothetical protein
MNQKVRIASGWSRKNRSNCLLLNKYFYKKEIYVDN